jgi:hypothetical protein
VGSVVIVLILAAGLVAVLWTGTLIVQAYLYNQPVQGIAWRAPVAGAVIGLFYWGWCQAVLAVPGKYDTLFRFAPTDQIEYSEFTAVKRYPLTGREEQEQFALKTGGGGRRTYYSKQTRKLFQRSTTDYLVVAIIVKEPNSDTETTFKAVLDKRKVGDKEEEFFRIEPNINAAKYVAPDGREMFDDQLGLVTQSSTLVIVGTLTLNLLHYLLWLTVFWPLLRYGLGMALGLATSFWLLLTLFILPLIFDYLTARPSATPPTATPGLAPPVAAAWLFLVQPGRAWQWPGAA